MQISWVRQIAKEPRVAGNGTVEERDAPQFRTLVSKKYRKYRKEGRHRRREEGDVHYGTAPAIRDVERVW